LKVRLATVPDVVGEGYDAVYRAWSSSPTFHELWARTAVDGRSIDGFEHLNFATSDQLHRVLVELQLSRGARLVDIACGAGGPGLWIAKEAGVSLVGVDLSSVGSGLAARRAQDHGIAGAGFVVASATAVPLADASVAGVMSLDSLQYVPDKRATFDEIARVLRPGGRLVFTAFELDPSRAAGLPVLGEDPTADYSDVLREAGLRVETYQETPGWKQHLEGAYTAVVEADGVLRAEMGDEAMNALLLEMTLTLQVQPYRRRVFTVASLP
jgi:ubiquinone/menaquinone biosynthesis C-methylase UbiE